MPTIEINLKDLENLLGKSLENHNLEELFSYVKAEIDERKNDILKLEMKDTARPDLWSVEGIARELKGILGFEKGLPKYEILKSNFEVIVDEKLKNIRPYIACAIVKDVNLGKYGYSSLIQLQDKVMETFGRKRRKVAIGTSNFDLIKFPVYYKAVKPEEISFAPLNESRKLNLKEILEKTEKGREYGNILRDKDLYPILIDSEGKVISFPPIINSNDVGRIDEKTRNIFIDVTGTDLESVLTALNVIVTSLAERNGKTYSVIVRYPDFEIETPDLNPKEIHLDLSYFKKISGLNLEGKDIIELLRKKRFDAEIYDGRILVRYLPYRSDILSQQDLVEDILISYGFNNIEPKKIEVYTIGKERKIKKFLDLIREIMISLGCIEIHNTVITSKEIFEKIGLKNYVEIENPISSKYNIIRPSLIPEALEFLSYNKKEELPQEIFEIGDVVKFENKIYETYNLIYMITDRKITVNDSKRKLIALLNNLGLDFEIKREDFPFCIPGRTGKIYINNEEIGIIGEIHPEVLLSFTINTPISFFEIDLKKLFIIYQKEIKKK